MVLGSKTPTDAYNFSLIKRITNTPLTFEPVNTYLRREMLYISVLIVPVDKEMVKSKQKNQTMTVTEC